MRVGQHLHRLEDKHFYFDAANYLYLGADEIAFETERHELIQCLVRAGRRAIKLAAFNLSTNFLRKAVGQVKEGDWGNVYSIVLDAYSALAEAEYYVQNYDVCIQRVEDIVSHAQGIESSLRARNTRMQAWAEQKKYGLILREVQAIASELGEKVPAMTYPNAEKAVKKTRKLVDGTTMGFLDKLAPCTNDRDEWLIMSLATAAHYAWKYGDKNVTR
jgi:predicted ATPase